jgi:hypothetical protein
MGVNEFMVSGKIYPIVCEDITFNLLTEEGGVANIELKMHSYSTNAKGGHFLRSSSPLEQ